MIQNSQSIDFRKLTRKAQEEIRIDSVRRVRQGEESPEKVAKEYGYSRTNIYGWLSIHKKKGYKGLKSRKSTGRPPTLTKAEHRRLKNWLGKDPRQLKFHYGLWTIKMVKQLIQDKFGVLYGTTTIHDLLKTLGYSYQKPIQQNSKKVQIWMKEEYPRIKKEAKKEGRDVYFADESGFQSIHNKMKTWGKKGERPVLAHTGRRFSKGVISAITPQGKIRFMKYDGAMNSELFIVFLKRIQINEKRNITLILDGLGVHKSKVVKEYVKSTDGKIRIYILPGYSPELNPEELVWSAAKGYVSRRMVRTKEELESHISTFMHSIQKRTGFIQRLFDHKDVAYINDA